MTKSILLWFLLSVVNLAAGILNYPLAPLVVLFQKDGWLPSWLWWMQTPDSPLSGDAGWQTKLPWLTNTYLRRVAWLYRNSMYGLSIDVLGSGIKEGFRYRSWGDERTGNRPLRNGWIFRRVDDGDKPTAWQFYLVHAWSETMCIRINLGWKIWSNPKAGDTAQLVFSANPFMGYSR